LIAETNVGLIKAVGKFNPKLGFKFSTYATHDILSSIRSAYARGNVLNIPLYIRELIPSFNRAITRLEIHHIANPDAAEIAREMGVTAWLVERIIRTKNELRTPVRDSLSNSRITILPSISQIPSSEKRAILQEEVQGILRGVSNPRAKKIIILRFGLDGKKPRTLEQIGKKIGRTRERVRQILEEESANARITAQG